MSSTHRTLVLILALVVVAVPPHASAETEPNDSIAQAVPVGIGYQNATLDATLNTSSDKDYYALSTPAGRTYVIETFNIQAASSDYATALYVFNAGGTKLADDVYGLRGTGGADARITYTFATAGTYYVMVQSPGVWTGTYGLRILPKHDEPGAGWDAANDNEPNDEPALAIELALGVTQAQTHQLAPTMAFVTNDADRDYYRFRAEAGRTYVMETYAIQAAASNMATGLRLYNASGVELAADQAGSRGTGGVNARLVYTFATAGTYYLAVTEGVYTTWAGTYSVRLLAKHTEPGASWDPANDDEPNDVAALARPLGIGVDQAQTHQLAPYKAFVSYDSDYDWYHFAAQAGRTYVIETVNVPRLTTGLYLHSATGDKLAADEYGTTGSGSVGARVTYTIVNAGTYYVLVKDSTAADWSGTYTVRVCDRQCGRPLYLPITQR